MKMGTLPKLMGVGLILCFLEKKQHQRFVDAFYGGNSMYNCISPPPNVVFNIHVCLFSLYL